MTLASAAPEKIANNALEKKEKPSSTTYAASIIATSQNQMNPIFSPHATVVGAPCDTVELAGVGPLSIIRYTSTTKRIESTVYIPMNPRRVNRLLPLETYFE